MKPLTMRQAAEIYGDHYDTFRKRWRDLANAGEFPAPFRCQPYRWHAEEIEAWKHRDRRPAEDVVVPMPVRAPKSEPRVDTLAAARAAASQRQRRRLAS